MLENLRTKLHEDREDARYLRLLNKCDTDKTGDDYSVHVDRNTSSQNCRLEDEDVDEAGYLHMRSLRDQGVDEAGYLRMHSTQ